MDTIEVNYNLKGNQALTVFRDGKLLYKYDVWKDLDGQVIYFLVSSHNPYKDIAGFKVKEVKGI